MPYVCVTVSIQSAISLHFSRLLVMFPLAIQHNIAQDSSILRHRAFNSEKDRLI